MVMPNVNLGNANVPSSNPQDFVNAVQQQLQQQNQQGVSPPESTDTLTQPEPSPQPPPQPESTQPDQNALTAQLYQQYMQNQALLTQQVQQQAQQKDQYEAALYQKYLEDNVPEEYREQQWNTYVAYKQMEGQLAQREQMVQGYQSYLAQMEQAITPMIRNQVVTQMSQKSGVPKEVLGMANTPQELQTLIQAYQSWQKKTNLQQRREQGNDKVADTSGQQPSGPSAGALDEVRKHYRNSGDIKGYLDATRKAQAGQAWK